MMDFSEEERAFVDALGLSADSVGDGTDAKPMWIAVDVQRRRVYKVFATGRCEGFADDLEETLIVFNGLPAKDRWGGFALARQVACGEGQQVLEDGTRVAAFGVPAVEDDEGG